MPLDIYQDYVKSMVLIKAEEKIGEIQVVSFPQSKTEDRKKIWKHYSKQSQNGSIEAMTPEEIARKLNSWQTKK